MNRKIIVIAIIVTFALIMSFVMYENQGHPTQLSSITITSVNVNDNIVTVSGYHHNSAMVSKGHDIQISNDNLYITVKTGMLGNSPDGFHSDKVSIMEQIPKNVSKIYIVDGKEKQLLWVRQ